MGYDNMSLKMVVPWTLPEDLKGDKSEAKAKVEEVFNRKVGKALTFTSALDWKPLWDHQYPTDLYDQWKHDNARR